MAHSLRTLRLVSASALALLLVAGTYLATGPSPFFGIGRIASAQSAEELLREYAGKDTDADGLPDWQEALYGTDPANPESFQAGISDGEAVAQGLIQPKVAVRPEDEPTDINSIPGTVAAPSSLTDRFSQTLLKQYLLNRGENPPTPEEITAFVTGALGDLAASTRHGDTYATSDVRLSAEQGTPGLYTYAAAAEQALASENIRPAKNELFYFSDAVKGDAAALTKIRQISEAYIASSRALMQVPVPEEARRSHLAMANALANMGNVTADLAALKTDPLRALVGLSAYDQYASDLARSFANVHGIFAARQVSIPEGQNGAEFLFLARDSQQTLSEMQP